MRPWPAPHVPAIPGHGDALRLFAPGLGGQVTAGGPGPVSIAVCGVAPWGGAGLEDVATGVTADLIVRAWRDQGLTVASLVHVADADVAAATDADGRQVVEGDLASYSLDMTALGVIPPDHYVATSEVMPEVICAVDELLTVGAAYQVAPGSHGVEGGPGDVFAAVADDPGLGSVSGLSRSDLVELGRQTSREPGQPGVWGGPDPVLWRRERPGEPSWDGSGLAAGRPGPSVSGAAAIRARLGAGCDVLVGAGASSLPQELVASHLRALTGAERPVRCGVRGSGVSDPSGVLVSELLRHGVSPTAIRLVVLAHHYRELWVYEPAELDAALGRLARWTAAVSGNGGPPTDRLVADVRAALADDLDAPRAVAAVDDWVDQALSYGQPGGLTDDDVVEGAPGVAARAVDALLGVRL